MVDFAWPTTTTNVTSGFRPPHRPTHNGIDIADGGDHPILATADGTVSQSYTSTSYGEVIFIKHVINGVDYETVYAHMKTGSRAKSVGQTVIQGEYLGDMGSTGISSGIHLHFEINIPNWVQGGANAVDPMPYLDTDIPPDPPDPPEPDRDYVPLLRQTNMRRMGVRGRR